MSLEPVPRTSKRPTGSLTSFRDEAKHMKEEREQVEATNRRLQEEVNMLKSRLKQVDKQYSSLAESKSRDDGTSRDLEKALEEAKEENSKRVADTSQFQQMRKLMQSQSTKLRDLRKRLQKYEPDAAKEEDDF
jgi:chromosome segregation ATPase